MLKERGLETNIHFMRGNPMLRAARGLEPTLQIVRMSERGLELESSLSI